MYLSKYSLKFYFRSLTTFSAKVLLTTLSKGGLEGIRSALYDWIMSMSLLKSSDFNIGFGERASIFFSF
jgi:hypothetical protein